MTTGSTGRSVTIAAVTLAVIAFWPARHAQACSPPVCRTGSFLPAPEARIPANAPALIHLPGSAAVAGAPTREQLHDQIELLTQEGTAVPFITESRPQGMLLRPVTGPWPPGILRVRRPELCAGIGTVTLPPPMVEQRFSVTAPVPLPTALGTVYAGHSQMQSLTVAHDGECTTEIRAAVVTLTILPTPEFQAFLPLAEINVYERSPEHPGALNQAWARKSDSDPLTLSVYASCETDRPAHVGNGLTPGLHQLEIAASIAGATQPLPGVRVVVDLDCDDSVLGCSLAARAAPASPFLAISGGLLLAAVSLRPISRRRRRRRRHPSASSAGFGTVV
jgi:hypothetical protein